MYKPTEEYIDMWRRGWSCTSLAELAGVSRSTFTRGMAALGFGLLDRPQPNRDKAIETVRALKAAGMKNHKISELVGYSERNIQRWFE